MRRRCTPLGWMQLRIWHLTLNLWINQGINGAMSHWRVRRQRSNLLVISFLKCNWPTSELSSMRSTELARQATYTSNSTKETRVCTKYHSNRKHRDKIGSVPWALYSDNRATKSKHSVVSKRIRMISTSWPIAKTRARSRPNIRQGRVYEINGRILKARKKNKHRSSHQYWSSQREEVTREINNKQRWKQASLRLVPR